MPRPKTSGRDGKAFDSKTSDNKTSDNETSDNKTCDRKPRKAPARTKTEENATAASQADSAQAAPSPAPTPSNTAPAEITIESLIRDLGEALKIAVNRGRPTAAVAAAVAIARLLHALPDKGGRPPSPHRHGRGPAPPPKFDGNYHDAARRVAFLLGLGKKQKTEQPGAAGEADGSKT